MQSTVYVMTRIGNTCKSPVFTVHAITLWSQTESDAFICASQEQLNAF